MYHPPQQQTYVLPPQQYYVAQDGSGYVAAPSVVVIQQQAPVYIPQQVYVFLPRNLIRRIDSKIQAATIHSSFPSYSQSSLRQRKPNRRCDGHPSKAGYEQGRLGLE